MIATETVETANNLRIKLGLFIAVLRQVSIVAYDGILVRLPKTVTDDETGLQVPGMSQTEHFLMLHDNLETDVIAALVHNSRNRAILAKRVADAVKDFEANG